MRLRESSILSLADSLPRVSNGDKCKLCKLCLKYVNVSDRSLVFECIDCKKILEGLWRRFNQESREHIKIL